MARPKLTVHVREIVERAVEEGIESGWERAHKHTETPRQETILEEIKRAIMFNLDEAVRLQ